MALYDATIKALKDGVQNLTASAAVKNIESWEKQLGDNDTAGIKPILKDLGHLKELLQQKQLDSAAITKLVKKLGKETVAIAGHVDGKDGAKVKQVGEALTAGAEG